MRVWEKPVLSVLGVDKTHGGQVFRALSGVQMYADNLDEVTADHYKRDHNDSIPKCSKRDRDTRPPKSSSRDD